MLRGPRGVPRGDVEPRRVRADRRGPDGSARRRGERLRRHIRGRPELSRVSTPAQREDDPPHDAPRRHDGYDDRNVDPQPEPDRPRQGHAVRPLPVPRDAPERRRQARPRRRLRTDAPPRRRRIRLLPVHEAPPRARRRPQEDRRPRTRASGPRRPRPGQQRDFGRRCWVDTQENDERLLLRLPVVVVVVCPPRRRRKHQPRGGEGRRRLRQVPQTPRVHGHHRPPPGLVLLRLPPQLLRAPGLRRQPPKDKKHLRVRPTPGRRRRPYGRTKVRRLQIEATTSPLQDLRRRHPRPPLLPRGPGALSRRRRRPIIIPHRTSSGTGKRPPTTTPEEGVLRATTTPPSPSSEAPLTGAEEVQVPAPQQGRRRPRLREELRHEAN
mmetsp:Transcript_28294/g.91237  ORF Transcript_28294/g.91237 Transcript_28294/m.91237 type:complete len:381 (+) Transcript_28294:777-1919(+)